MKNPLRPRWMVIGHLGGSLEIETYRTRRGAERYADIVEKVGQGVLPTAVMRIPDASKLINTVYLSPLVVGDYSIDDRVDAAREGWDVFECQGSKNGSPQIQSFDCPEEGDADITEEQAWELVLTKAIAGSLLHIRALALTNENPKEIAAILNHCDTRTNGVDA